MKALSLEDKALPRMLARLTRPGAMLARDPRGGVFALYPSADKRRRPVARFAVAVIDALAREGALAPDDRGGFELTPAGRARLARTLAAPDESWRAQHEPIVERAAIDTDGDLRVLRGLAANPAAQRLSRVRDGAGAPFFSGEELAAAARLGADWIAGQAGLVRGVDWSAPPRGSAPRGAGGGVEAARAGAIDARRRVEDILSALTPGAARLVRAACLEQAGLEAIERREQWPARSGKVALKLALGELAHAYRRSARRNVGAPAKTPLA